MANGIEISSHRAIVEMNVTKDSPDGTVSQIKVFCIYGECCFERSVIELYFSQGRWTVDSSTVLPVNIGEARVVQKCFNLAFEALDLVKFS